VKSHIYLETDNSWTGVLGTSTKGKLIARCKSNKTQVYFDAGQVIKTEFRYSSSPVTYRFDEKKAISASWSGSTDHKSVFAAEPIGLLRQLAQHNRLRILGLRAFEWVETGA